jgi:hypothetical protein
MFDFLKGFFNAGVKAFKKFLKIALPIAKQAAIGYLSSMAMEKVAGLEGSSLSGVDKRNLAANELSKMAADKDIFIEPRDINLLIELALSAVRK